jgi:CheY-like chemotaxis protein
MSTTMFSQSLRSVPLGARDAVATALPDLDSGPSWIASEVGEAIHLEPDFEHAGSSSNPDSPAAQGAATASAAARLARILLVDDIPGVRELLAEALRAEGYEVVSAANGREALEQCGNSRTDVMLLDLDTPARSGWDPFQQLLSLNPMQAVVIIAEQSNAGDWEITGHPTWLVEKPVRLSVMLESVRTALEECAADRVPRKPKPRRYTPSSIPRPGLAATVWPCEHWDHGGIND